MKYKTELSPINTLSTVILICCFFLLPATGMAEVVATPQWQITADKIIRYEAPASIIAEGNVVLKKTRIIRKRKKAATGTGWSSLLNEKGAGKKQAAGKGQIVTRTQILTTIKADWIVYDVARSSIKARGHIFVRIGPDTLTAETARLDLNTETGTFTNATIVRQAKNLHLEGRVIEKTGNLTYHIEDGWVITCKLKNHEAPPWSFAAADARITDNGYAFLKDTTFRIKGVPVLYSPYMILPIKHSRQTGFLFPSFSMSNRDGFGLNLPLFVNLSPSSDITLYPEYMAKRGLMAGAEFRYVRDRSSMGDFMVNYLHDGLSDPSETDYYRDGNYTHTNKDRYWLRGKVDQNFGAWTTRLDLDVVSDRDYLTEFTSGLTGFTVSNQNFAEVFGRSLQNKTTDERKNTLRVLRSWKNMSLQGELLGINDVRATRADPTPLWKLPSLNFTGLLPVAGSSVDFDWDADYVNFWRESGVGANRIDLFPRLSMPLPLGDYLESTATVGVRDTAYLIHEYGQGNRNGSGTKNRFLVDLKVGVGTTMIRDFNVHLHNVSSLSHTLRPYVNYHYIPDVDQTDLPQFDNIDNIAGQSLVTYGLDNFFKISGRENNRDYQRRYAYVKIRQSYDLRSQRSDTPLTPLYMEIGYWPLREFRIIYKTDVDMYGAGVIYHSLEAGYRNSRGDTLSTDYLYRKAENINSINVSAKVHLFYNLLAGYSIERSIEDSKTVEENIALIYQPSCWSVELSSNYTPGNQKIMLMFTLANIGNPLGIDLPGF